MCYSHEGKIDLVCIPGSFDLPLYLGTHGSKKQATVAFPVSISQASRLPGNIGRPGCLYSFLSLGGSISTETRVEATDGSKGRECLASF